MFNLNGRAPTEIQLTPSGRFKAKDGRPQGLPGWNIHRRNADQILAAASNQKDQFLVDYDHQTLYTRENGQPAPAAAWFKNLEWREGVGLFATDVEWTETAKVAIESREYRYISPVLSYDKKTGNITGILMAALVNYPAIDGLNDLSAQAAAHFSLTNPEENPVDEELLTLLGLAPSADGEAVKQAVTSLKARADQVSALETEVAVLKAENPDPEKYVPVATVTALRDQIAALSTQVNDRELNELIQAGLSDGRILPEMEDWARSLGKKDLAALKGFIETAQPIAALKRTQTDGNPPREGGNGLTSDETAVCKQLGLSEEEFKKNRGGES